MYIRGKGNNDNMHKENGGNCQKLKNKKRNFIRDKKIYSIVGAEKECVGLLTYCNKTMRS
jgi:hypothetical protein